MSTSASDDRSANATTASALNVSYLEELLQRHGELCVEHLLAFEPVPIDDAARITGNTLPLPTTASLQKILTADAFASIFGDAGHQNPRTDPATMAAHLSQVIVSTVNALGSARHADEWLASRHPTLGNEAPIALATKPFGYKLVTGMLGFISSH